MTTRNRQRKVVALVVTVPSDESIGNAAPFDPELEVAIPVGDLLALVDEADFPLVTAYSWHPLVRANVTYACASRSNDTIYMHRLIVGTAGELHVDHRNRDGLDNRRANLRIATRTQNRVNSRKPRRADGQPSASSLKGVYCHRRNGRWTGKWLARIGIDGKSRYLGLFASEIDAARAYDAAALEAWGEFARPNFPIEVTS